MTSTLKNGYKMLLVCFRLPVLLSTCSVFFVMENCWRDFVEYLGPDAAAGVFLRLDDPGDLVRATSVSHHWRRLVITNGFCKKLCLRKFPEVPAFICVNEVGISTKNVAVKVGCSTAPEWESQEREHRVYSYLGHYLFSPLAKRDCIFEAIDASSTDRNPDESIRNTLEPRNRVNQRWRYWSSKGQSNPGVPETLTYILVSKICVVHEIKIKPFKAFFHHGFPIYSAEAVRFRMGHSRIHQEAVAGMTAPVDPEAPDYIWTYVSPEFPMVQNDGMQSFKLPHPVLCIGGIVQVELLGRVQKCYIDDLYYLCVSRVEVIGNPLPPVFDVDILETLGDSILKYFPQATGHTVRK